MDFDRSRSRAGASRRRSGSVGHEPRPADEGRTAGGAGAARVDPVGPGLEALSAFLASDRAPPGCMTLPELDGFLASLAAGPGRVPDPGGRMPPGLERIVRPSTDPAARSAVEVASTPTGGDRC